MTTADQLGITPNSSRLSAAFARHRHCLIPFLTAGHPDLESSERILVAMAEAGAQAIEIGIPFSDPIADGPVIQRASYDALRHGYSMEDYLEMVRRVRTRTSAALLFMTYLNPVQRFGLERLDCEGSEAGLDAVLITDLTPEEYERMPPFRSLDTVFLAAPTSSDARLDKICAASRGFVYLVARTGITGRHTDIGEQVERTIARIRQRTRLPIAVGFGIDSPEAVARVWRHAEGAVVGTAIVRFIEENRDRKDLPEAVGRFVKELIPVFEKGEG